MSLTVDLAVEDPSWAAVPDLQALVERAAGAALAEAGVDPGEALELSCLFCDDDAIRALNAQWRGKDRPTNVLSFPAPDTGVDLPDAAGAGALLGDIAVAWGTVVREAEAEDKRVEDHVAHLIVHGTLHLLGEDHEDEAEAESMEALERRAMARLGLPDPYAGTVPEGRPGDAGDAGESAPGVRP